ncbi:hypothetical protein BV25DRAFT_1842154 [Artomyces pyxidatus]|uniref:Uncharacterized protein n=1 Tax=Artomyces pyxidatus TaxID=48021 RepID=A0ACB8SL25_9AGAM|nr:hypothetical protein BV25DRAFT_1842154 [Artomyces pyxidatus]
MSWLALSNGVLVRDMWPGIVATRECRHSRLYSASWQRCPAELEDVFAWCKVLANKPRVPEDRLKQYSLIHQSIDVKPLGRRGIPHPVSFRVQGFLADFNLQLTGNWNGDIGHAPAAIQHVRLDGGAFEDIFSGQVDALRNVAHVVQESLCPDSPKPVIDMICPDGTIYANRNVFMPHPSANGLFNRSVELTPVEDPDGAIAAIAHSWRIPYRSRFGRRNDMGYTKELPPSNLQRGDFIEITAELEMFMNEPPNAVPTFEVRLRLRNLVRLCKAEFMPLVLTPGHDGSLS